MTKSDRWFTKSLVFLPLVMMYKVPVVEVQVPTLLTALGMFYAIIVLVKRRIKISFMMLLPLLLFLFYVILKSVLLTAFIYMGVILIICAISTGIINVQLLRRILEKVAVVAAVCVLFQQLIHYSMGIHVPFFFKPLMAENILTQYSFLLTSGVVEGDTMYRPSAFFLEPASFSQYCIIGLGSCLFNDKPNIRRALLISLGIFACTSGMGFVSVFAIWGVWSISRQKSKKKIIKKIPLILLTIALVFYVLNSISFTHDIINRFTTSDPTEYNAINGRLFWWDTYFGNFKVSDFLYGYGSDNLPEDAYFTGFMTLLFSYGVIGVSFLLLFLIVLIFKSDTLGMVCTSLYTGLLFFANLTYYHSILFFIGCYLALYVESKTTYRETQMVFKNRINENTIVSIGERHHE